MGRSLSRERMIEAVNALERFGTQHAAAKFLGIPRNTLQSRLYSAGIAGIHALKQEQPIKEVPPLKPVVRVQAGSSAGSKVIRCQGIGDCHDDPSIPDKRRFRWLGKHAADFGATHVRQIGDLETFDSLNTHISNDTLSGKSKNPFYRDLESLEEALSEYQVGLGSHKPDLEITLGNHERRAWLFEEANPESQNLLTGPLTCLLEQYGWRWKEYGEWSFLGGVGFIHAPINKMGKTFGGETRQNVLNKMVFDIVRGHDHQHYDQPSSKFGPIGNVTLVGLGCALPHGHIETYAKHALNGWAWGDKELLISGGRIESSAFVSMLELERRYG